MAAPLRVRGGVDRFPHLLERAATADIGDGIVDVLKSDGFGLSLSKAATAMIIPLWQ